MEQADAQTVADTFLAGWTQRFGSAEKIFSDNGNTFKADLWSILNKKLGQEVKFVPPHHQATNGAVERTHLDIKNGLRAALVEIGDTKREKWMDYLPFVMLGRHSAVINDLKVSPGELVFGEPLTLPGAINDPSQP